MILLNPLLITSLFNNLILNDDIDHITIDLTLEVRFSDKKSVFLNNELLGLPLSNILYILTDNLKECDTSHIKSIIQSFLFMQNYHEHDIARFFAIYNIDTTLGNLRANRHILIARSIGEVTRREDDLAITTAEVLAAAAAAPAAPAPGPAAPAPGPAAPGPAAPGPAAPAPGPAAPGPPPVQVSRLLTVADKEMLRYIVDTGVYIPGILSSLYYNIKGYAEGYLGYEETIKETELADYLLSLPAENDNMGSATNNIENIITNNASSPIFPPNNLMNKVMAQLRREKIRPQNIERRLGDIQGLSKHKKKVIYKLINKGQLKGKGKLSSGRAGGGRAVLFPIQTPRKSRKNLTRKTRKI